MAHDHAHSHAHATPRNGTAFAVGISLNVVFVVVEAVYGVLAHSMALVSDAMHNLSDVLGLAIAWGATVLAARKPTSRRTYGLRKSTILSALANAALLLIAVGGISWEAVQRFSDPAPVAGATVMIVAAVGVLINGSSALLFLRGSQRDVNIRGAFLHLAADAAVSVGVVLAGLVVLKTGWLWVDPAVSVAISIVVLGGTWGLLRSSLDLALDAVPSNIDPEGVRDYLASLPGVREVHDLHIWAMSTTEVALTAHLLVSDGSVASSLLRASAAVLHERFHIDHPTIQIEAADESAACALAQEGSL